MKKQKIWLSILSILLVFAFSFGIYQTVVADIFIPPPFEVLKIFEDVNILHPFATWIGWLKDNGITSGYMDGTFRPDNYITRAEMAVMLKNTASTVVAAGAHVERVGGEWVITEWFNNVNGQKPEPSWFLAHMIDFGFDMENRLVACTVDMADSVSAFCSVKKGEESVLVSVYDVQADPGFELLQPIGFWVLVYGNDIQP